MAMNRASFPKSLEPNIRTYFDDTARTYPSCYDKIFKQVKTKRAWEEDTLFAGFGAAKQTAEGGTTEYDRMIEGWSAYYEILKWSLGFMLTEEAMEDNQYMDLAIKGSKNLARSFGHTKEIVHAAILNNAFDSNYLGGDGKELCATDHPTLGEDAGDLRNELAVAADLSEASVEQAIIDIGNFQDERGIYVKYMAKDLVVPNGLQFEAHRILKSAARSGTADNDTNALKDMSILQRDPIVWRYLSSAKAWFITTDCDDGLKTYQRRGYKLKTWGDERTGNYHTRASERFAPGWTNPRGVFGSPGVS